MKLRRFRAGDRVLVRSPEEILATLDADGTLDGLPFMPEMLDWCGKPFVSNVESRRPAWTWHSPRDCDVFPQTTW